MTRELKRFVKKKNEMGNSGYEFTGGFTDRTTGLAGVSDVGSNVQYTTAEAAAGTWLRFGIDTTSHRTNDVQYWEDPVQVPLEDKGLFAGQYMPWTNETDQSLYEFSFDEDPGYSAAVTTGDLQYTAATGSLNFTQCRPGDLLLCRFDFNALPQVANSTVEVALIWQTRDADGNATQTFSLATQPIAYSVGTVGFTYLNRPLISAYFASEEDVAARALPAIKCDNQIQIQPLTMLTTIVR